jgi:transcriptional regulator with XRE-family HTH domain
MEMSDRVKDIRSTKGMTQAEFAKLIGIGQSTLGMMEVSKRKISERHIKSICSICNINEDWLRNGDGDMFAIPATDVYNILRNQYNMSDTEEKILRAYFAIDEGNRHIITDFIQNISIQSIGTANTALKQPAVEEVDQETSNKVIPSKRKMDTTMKQSIVNAELADEEKAKMS